MIASLSGIGSSFTSFGELVQGCSRDSRSLISLPIKSKSNATIDINLSPDIINSNVNCRLSKSRIIAEYLISRIFPNTPFFADLKIESDIPVGKGLSSSTADTNATVNAILNATGHYLSDQDKSMLFSIFEPHDPVHLSNCCLYNPDTGELIEDFNFVPPVSIISLDYGGILDTIIEKERSSDSYDQERVNSYEKDLSDISEALRKKSVEDIFNISHRSSLREINYHPIWSLVDIDILKISRQLSSYGAVLTHSGTCIGFAMPHDINQDERDRAESVLEPVKSLCKYCNLNWYHTVEKLCL